METRNRILIVIFTGIVILIAGGGTQVVGQDISSTEKKLAQAKAQHFVKMFQKTRDISPLIPKMFSNSFVPRYGCDLGNSSPSFYASLSSKERQRFFAVDINAIYLVTVDVLQGTDYINENPKSIALTGILPPEMASRLRSVLAMSDRENLFSDYADFRARLPKIESMLTEARDHLKKSNIEQTAEFQVRLDDKITNSELGYKVELASSGDYSTNCPEFEKIPAQQKLFYVTTPLHFAVVLVNDGGTMKIVALTAADND